MQSGQLVFAQVMAYLPLKAFSRMVASRRAQHKVQDFSCLDQFLVLAFAQLTARESLRDIEINLRAQRKNFYRMGLRCKTISRNTLANANRVRPWEVFAELAHHLIKTARTLYADEPTNSELNAFDLSWDFRAKLMREWLPQPGLELRHAQIKPFKPE